MKKCQICSVEISGPVSLKNCPAHKGMQPKHYRIDKGNLKRKCPKCSQWRLLDDHYYKRSSRSGYITRCKQCTIEDQKAKSIRGKLIKRELVDIAGGGCTKCGYSECLASLVFHHVDPSTKSFEMSVGKLERHSTLEVLQEFQKCTLLCQNCHNEVHYGV